MQVFVTVFCAGDIGSGVEIAAILLLDNHAHRFAFLVFILIKEHHGRAFAFYRQTFGFQIGNDTRQHRVIEAFTHYVVAGQGDVEAVIGKLVLRHGNVDQLAPHFAEVLVAALQLNDVAARALGEGFIFVVVFFRFAIETFEVGQRHLAGVFLLLLFQVRDQHAELGAPVTHVVRADHFMPEKLQRTHRGIANNGGAQVAYVHLFRHVRRGVIDHHRLRLRLSHAQTFGFQRAADVFREEGRVEENINKAGTGDFDLTGNAAQVEMSQDLLCKLSRRHAQFFGYGHHAVGLIVAELDFC